jgi:predicted alpha-1,2-mannosidase
VKGERRQSVAVTLAAAYDAWCLAQIAQELGRTEDAAYFAKHALDYRNLWKSDTQFFHPKDKDGKWIEPFDYKYAGGQGARDYYDENNGWTYIWEVYHNVPDLIQLFGSAEAFNAKLDRLFVEGPNRAIWEFYNVLPDSTGLTGMFVMGNEPSLHIPYLYNYSGQPWKTQAIVREYLAAKYHNSGSGGYDGDEDCGQMSAWYVFGALGFYPVAPGSGEYAIGSPLFDEVSIAIGAPYAPAVFKVVAKSQSPENRYIQSATLNGARLERPFLRHADIVKGGALVFEMGPLPNERWGVGK